MGANTTASSKVLRGHTISEVQEIVYLEYMHWFRTGEQNGVLNLIGPAGIGKTEGLYQVAQKIREKNNIPNCQVVELYLSALIDPESAAGTPIPVDFQYQGQPCKALALASRKELLQAMESGRGPIMFIDEMGREADQLRPLIMKLLHEKKLGGLDVSNFFIVVAGNPSDEEHNTVAIQEDAALSSRLIDIPVKPDVTELHAYFSKFSKSHLAVADFLLDNPQYMHGRDSEKDQSSKFHSPRSWFNAACKLHLHGKGTDQEAGSVKEINVSIVLTGTIGPQAFTHFRNFMSMDKPLTVKDILSGRFKTPLRSVPASTHQALKVWLNDQDITDKQADNLQSFLEAIPADTARAIMREASAGHIKASNNRKLVKRGVYSKFVDKMITVIKKDSSSEAE